MKPYNIFLVRHGESIGNVDKSVYKHIADWKIPLTIKGKQQANLAAANLKHQICDESVIVYCSPWLRTRQTAKLICKAFKKIIYKEDPRLREQEWGNYQEDHLSKKIDEERNKFGSFFYRMPYGESGADVYDRVTMFFDTLYRDFEKDDYPQNVIIVSHGLTIKAFMMRWFHWSPEYFDKIKTPLNCQIIKMQIPQSKIGEPQSTKYVLLSKLRLRT